MMDYNTENFVMPYDFNSRRDKTYESNRCLVLRDIRLKICDRLGKIEEIRYDIQKEIDKVRNDFKKLVEEAEVLDNNDKKRLLSLEKMADDYEEQFKKKLNEDLILFGKHKAYKEMLSELERALDSLSVEMSILS